MPPSVRSARATALSCFAIVVCIVLSAPLLAVAQGDGAASSAEPLASLPDFCNPSPAVRENVTSALSDGACPQPLDKLCTITTGQCRESIAFILEQQEGAASSSALALAGSLGSLDSFCPCVRQLLDFSDSGCNLTALADAANVDASVVNEELLNTANLFLC